MRYFADEATLHRVLDTLPATMAIPKIDKLEELMAKYIDKTKKIVNKEITRLTAPGDNFGSEMLKIDLLLKDEDGKQEDLHVVAKLIPENEFFREIFNVQVSFNIEKEFYNTVVPCLQEFERKRGVDDVLDFFPKLFGARNNLKEENDVVNADAVLILENLKTKGYENVDRYTGFDITTAKMILKKLAKFHAVPIVLKQKEPETFETKIKANLANSFAPAPIPKVDNQMDLIFTMLKQSEKCAKFIPKLKESLKTFGSLCDKFREPFATICHKDFWTNNIMLKFDDKIPVDVKFVDFQMYSYDTPAADLFFFLFGSLQSGVLKSNLDYLLTYYHRQFEETLKSLDCNLQFPYEKLLEEISLCTKWELIHTIFMHFFIINGPKGGLPPAKSLDDIPDYSHVKFNESAKERVMWILEECDRRGWLNF